MLDIQTNLPPDAPQVAGWAARLRARNGVQAARDLLFHLSRKFPQNKNLNELIQWHRPEWWADQEFSRVRLVRRTTEHFDFVWSVILNEDFARKLKHLPDGLTPKDVLQKLTIDESSLIPETRDIQWIVYSGDQPIGISMFVNINFQNRSAEQVMGILPEYDHTFDVSHAYCASLSWAFNSLGLHKVYGLIYGENTAAATLQERLGFQREAHFKKEMWSDQEQRYIDLVQIAMLQEEFDHTPRLQRLVQRGKRSSWLVNRQTWPRKPFKEFQV